MSESGEKDEAPPSPSVFSSMNVNVPPRLRRVLERTRSSGDVFGSTTPPRGDGGDTPSPIRLRRVVSAASARHMKLSFHNDAIKARDAIEAEADEVLGGGERPATADEAVPVLPPMANSASPAVPATKRRPSSAASRPDPIDDSGGGPVKKLTLDGVRALTPRGENDGTPARAGRQPALVRRHESPRVKTPVGVEPAHGEAVEAEAEVALPAPATPTKTASGPGAVAATPAAAPPRAVPGVVESPAVGVRPDSRGTEGSGTGLAERVDFGAGGVRAALSGPSPGAGDSQRRLDRFFDGVVGSPPPSPQQVSRDVEDRELWNVDDDDDARGRATSTAPPSSSSSSSSSTVATADEDAAVVQASGEASDLGLGAETSSERDVRPATVPDPPIDRDSVSSLEHVTVDIVEVEPAVETRVVVEPVPDRLPQPTDAHPVGKLPWIIICVLLVLFLAAVVALIIVSV